MANNVQALATAGVVDPNKLSAEQKKALENLSQQEISSMIAISKKLDTSGVARGIEGGVIF
jgi:hypothetical protein